MYSGPSFRGCSTTAAAAVATLNRLPSLIMANVVKIFLFFFALQIRILLPLASGHHSNMATISWHTVYIGWPR